ncbi:MAG TPA: DNA repair protein [Candidatus Choladousia intestinigallinarum]|nr:DNA repair protein [Candidatus Choladousia intestinigallinarum]
MGRIYFCIDLKSFYASVECVERGLDPMTANLVVADMERTDKTICLAVSPSMKALGVKNRCRVFEIPANIPYIAATPRMQLYIQYSADIYEVYLKYFSKEDIHVYSIDEAFMDVTDYLPLYRTKPRELALKIMEDIRETVGVTAAGGIGTNLYLAKVALDITAKHSPEHIGCLDEKRYRETLWNHRPLTDFWRIGRGTENRLARLGILTMGQVAQADEELLYKNFGIDAELLIDHAWGREPVTMQDIKNYRPKHSSLSSGQVLPRDYTFEEGELILKEMTDGLCLELAEKHLAASVISLMVGYSNSLGIQAANGSVTMGSCTSSYRRILSRTLELYRRITDRRYPVRRMTLSLGRLEEETYRQLDLFSDPQEEERERRLADAALKIKKRYGKNAILRGMDLEAAGTTMERNRQIGGHKSGC